jgi:predicted lysophospholipase L1 biosynthesis ABC-type transport system permease subunit
MIQLGDYVAQMHPKETFPLKKGIVVESSSDSYTVHWTSYNKNFFMEFEGDAFEELNSRYLLTKMSYNRTNYNVDIIALSKAG